MRLLTIGILLISSSIGLIRTLHAQPPEITATAYQTINVRSGPGTQFEIVGQLAEGDTVPVTGRDGENARWYRVTLTDDQQGWVSSFTVMLDGAATDLPIVAPGVAPESNLVRIVTFGRVNVRNGPGINYDVIGQLDVNEEARATARNNRNNDWLYIEHEIVIGWVAYFTVDVIGDATTLPIRVPDGSGEELVAPTSLIRARYNVRVRQSPDSDSEIIGIVEFDIRVTPVARTDDALWLYIAYEDVEGWALTELFDISEAYLTTLPIFTPRLIATPALTATPETEVTEEAP
jgi:uncharacterized protein YgiM (DUF1202 family)